MLREMLREHFGNEHKIATAYMDEGFPWAVIKSEGVKALQVFSLLLRGCWNAMEYLAYMEEIKVAFNIKILDYPSETALQAQR